MHIPNKDTAIVHTSTPKMFTACCPLGITPSSTRIYSPKNNTTATIIKERQIKAKNFLAFDLFDFFFIINKFKVNNSVSSR